MIRGYFRAVGLRDGRDILSALVSGGVMSGEIYFDRRGDEQLETLLSQLCAGDTLLLFRVQDVSTSLGGLFELSSRLRDKHVELRSLSEPWFCLSESVPSGELLFSLLEQFHQLYHSLELQQLDVGSQTAASMGDLCRPVGRPKGAQKSLVPKLNAALKMYQNDTMSVSDICRSLGLNERTFYRHLKVYCREIPHRGKGRKSFSDDANQSIAVQ